MTGPCAKQTVTATVVTPDGREFAGTNYCANPQSVCPRAGMPTGVGYELCRSVCQQPAHAEVNAVLAAGAAAEGSTLVIEGHTYACGSCMKVADAAGISQVLFKARP